jgi:hypothetical protein
MGVLSTGTCALDVVHNLLNLNADYVSKLVTEYLSMEINIRCLNFSIMILMCVKIPGKISISIEVHYR